MDSLKDIGTIAIAIAISLGFLCLISGMLLVAFAGIKIEGGGEKWLNLKITKDRRERSASASSGTPATILVESESDNAVEIADDLNEPNEGQELNSLSGGDGVNKADDDAFMDFFKAKTIGEIDSSFSRMIPSMPADRVEFWTTDCIRRKAALGAPNSAKSLQDISIKNPEWSMPFAVLIDWAVEAHDLPSAEKYLSEGLRRVSSPCFGFLLESGVKMHFSFHGKRSAVKFVSRWINAEIDESAKASLFHTLGDCLQNVGDEDGFQVSKELACLIVKSLKYGHFQIAYSYSESKGRWAATLHHYLKAHAAGENVAYVKNNLGVLYSSMDKAASIMFYERAMEDGNTRAHANLAHRLVEDGYANIALKILDEVNDPGDSEENFASARRAALASVRSTEENISKIANASKLESEKLRSSISSTLRAICNNEEIFQEGAFASDDGSSVVIIKDGIASCKISVKGVSLEGRVNFQASCYAGLLTSKGQSILSSEVRKILMIDEGAGNLKIFCWPSIASNADADVVELRRSGDGVINNVNNSEQRLGGELNKLMLGSGQS